MFNMVTSDRSSRRVTRGGGGGRGGKGGGPLALFQKLEKSAIIFGENALIVVIYG